MKTLLLLALAFQDRAPVPEANAQKEALKLIRDIFKDEYSKRGAADQRNFALKLLQQSLETKDDPVAKYVLLQEARGIAAEAGDASTALRAVDELSSRYAVNPISLKYVALSTAGLTAREPAQMSTAAEQLLGLTDEAITAQDVETAEKATAAATNLAKGAKNVHLTARASAKSKELADLKPKFTLAQKAKETLKTSPDDPGANSSVGRFICLVLGNWDDGLPYLAKGSDAALKALATRDRAGAKDPVDASLIGDAWWDLGEKESGKTREQFRTRASRWYQEAIPGLGGLSRAKVEKRLRELPNKVALGQPVNILKLIDLQKDNLLGNWAWDQKVLKTGTAGEGLEIPYSLPAEYDLVLRVERKTVNKGNTFSIILPLPESKVAISIDQEETGDVSGLSRIDDRMISDNATKYVGRLLALNVPSTVICAVRKTGVALQVDGKKVFDWRGELRRLNFSEGNGNRKDTALLAGHSIFHVSAIDLIPVNDPGKPLR
jgi:hypothetical protein